MPQLRDHHLHLPHFHIDNTRTLRLLYGVRVARSLGNKFALFFLPLFLFQLGRDTTILNFLSTSGFQKGIVMIALFYGLNRAVVFMASIKTAGFISKNGIQRSLVVGHLFYALSLVLLQFVLQNPQIIWLVIITNGLQTSFFWNSYYVLMSKNTLKQHIGEDLGALQVLLQLAAIISPALGGVVIVLLGYQILFLIALATVMVGAIFALMMDNDKVSSRASFAEFRRWIKEKRFSRLALSLSGRYIHDAALAIWPLYLFLLLGSADRVGFLYTLSLFMAMILSLFIGFYIDRHRSKKPFVFSGGIISALWIMRIWALNIWNIAIVDTVDKMTGNFHWLFFDSLLFRRGKGGKALAYFTYREMILSVAGFIFWSLFALFFVVFPFGWKGMFVLASVGVMMSILIREKEEIS